MLTNRLSLAPSISKEALQSEIVEQYSKTLKNQSFVIDTITLAENSFVFRGRLYAKNEMETVIGKGHLITKINKVGSQFQPEIFLQFSVEKATIDVGR